jgi:hypothetical protein
MRTKLSNPRKYPAFIRNNEVVKTYAKQERVWPRIGLDNCSKKNRKQRKT